MIINILITNFFFHILYSLFYFLIFFFINIKNHFLITIPLKLVVVYVKKKTYLLCIYKVDVKMYWGLKVYGAFIT